MTIAVAQSKLKSFSGSSTTIALTGCTVGNALIVIAGSDVGQLTAVHDQSSNNLTSDYPPAHTNNYAFISVWRLQSLSAASMTLTLTFAASNFADITVYEVSGLSGTPYDSAVSVYSTAASSPLNLADAADNAAASEILFAFADDITNDDGYKPSSTDQTNGWVIDQYNPSGAGNGGGWAHRIYTSDPGAAQSVSMVGSGGGGVSPHSAGIMVGYKGASGGGSVSLAAVVPSAATFSDTTSISHHLQSAVAGAGGILATLGHQLGAVVLAAAAILAGPSVAHTPSAAIPTNERITAGLSEGHAPSALTPSGGAIKAGISEGHSLAAVVDTADAIHATITSGSSGTVHLAAILPSAGAIATGISEGHSLSATEGSGAGITAQSSQGHALSATVPSGAGLAASPTERHALTALDPSYASLSARLSEDHQLAATEPSAAAAHATITTAAYHALVPSAGNIQAAVYPAHHLAAATPSASGLSAALTLSGRPGTVTLAATQRNTISLSASSTASVSVSISQANTISLAVTTN